MAKNSITQEGTFSADVRNRLNDNLRDVSVASATFSATSSDTGTTLTTVTGLTSDTLAAGQYTFRADLGVVSTANSGLKLALKQGTSSMISVIEYHVKAYGASSIAASRGTTTTDATAILASTAAYNQVIIEGSFTVQYPGTLSVQAAQNASHADTTSVYLGSTLVIQKVG